MTEDLRMMPAQKALATITASEREFVERHRLMNADMWQLSRYLRGEICSLARAHLTLIEMRKHTGAVR